MTESGLNEQIGAILSDPKQMKMIGELAGKLLGGESPNEEPAEAAENIKPVEGLAAALGLNTPGGGKRYEALLQAMRPYLRPERQEKLAKAMKLSRMLSMAGSVMKQGGGGLFGL